MDSSLNYKKECPVKILKKKDAKIHIKPFGLTQSDKKVGAIFKTPTSFNTNMQKSTPRAGSTSKIQTPQNCYMAKSKSTPVIPEKYVHLTKTKDKSLGTPVTHLCSPSLSPKGRRHFIQHSNCSVKRFLSDSSLNNSPLNSKEDATTPNNSSQLEVETSNFVVGVRVRPFNLRLLSIAII